MDGGEEGSPKHWITTLRVSVLGRVFLAQPCFLCGLGYSSLLRSKFIFLSVCFKGGRVVDWDIESQTSSSTLSPAGLWLLEECHYRRNDSNLTSKVIISITQPSTPDHTHLVDNVMQSSPSFCLVIAVPQFSITFQAKG